MAMGVVLPLQASTTMPRFPFRLTHDVEACDEAGLELDDLHAARRHAARLIADALCKEPERFWKSDIYRVSIADERGLLLPSVEMIAQSAPALWQTPLRTDWQRPLAIPAGLEPATTRLEGGCSIQLSYGIRRSQRVLVGFTAGW